MNNSKSTIESNTPIIAPIQAPCGSRDATGLPELLRHCNFASIEQATTDMLEDGIPQEAVLYIAACFMASDEQGQPRWMTVVDECYREAIAAVESGNLYARDVALKGAWEIMLARNAVM